MKLRRVRPLQGLAWVRAGFSAFGAQPLAYSAQLGLAGVMLLLISMLPGGPLLSIALLPLLSWGFTVSGREQAAGRRMPALPWLDALRDPRQRRGFAALGLLYAGLTFGSSLLADALDGGRFNAFVEQLARDSAAGGGTLDASGLEGSMALRIALLGAVSLVFWHAPALLVWGRKTVAQAVFGSVLACWRGLVAYLLMGLGWFLLLLVCLALVQVMLIGLGLIQAASLAALPAGMAFSTAFYASLWRVYTDSFEEEGPATAGAAAAVNPPAPSA